MKLSEKLMTLAGKEQVRTFAWMKRYIAPLECVLIYLFIGIF